MSAILKSNPEKIVSFDEFSDEKLTAFFKLATRLHWQVVSCDHLGIQLRLQKRYSATYFFAGALTALIGIGLLIWIVGWIDYAFKRDRLLYIPRKDLMKDSIYKVADQLL